MNKAFISIMFLLLCSCKSDTTHKESDSRSDSLKIASLNNIAFELQYRNLDSALNTYSEIATLSRNSHSVKVMMNYYKTMSAFYGIRLKDFDKSKKYLDSVWILANRGGNDSLKYLAYFVEGRYYLAIDDIILASNSFLKSIKSQRKPVDSLILFVTYSDLAKICFLQKDYEKAVAYYKPLMAYDERMRDTASMIKNYLNLYSYISHSKNKEKAIEYLYRAKYLTDITNYKSLHHILLFNFSIYHSLKGDFDSALYYVDDAIKEQNSKKVSPENSFKFLILKTQLLTDLKRFDDAEKTLKEATENTQLQQIELIDQSNYYETMCFLFKAEKKYSEALEALEKQNEIQKKININTKDEQLLNHEKALRRLSSENTIIAKNIQITKQRLYTIILLVACIMLGIIAFLFYQHLRKLKKIEVLKWNQKEKEKELENEKLLVQYQIEERNRISQEMHDDLGSTLTTISMAVELFNLYPNNHLPLQIINQSTIELSNKINDIVWSLNVHNDTLQSLIAYFRKFARIFLADAGIKLTWEQRAFDDEKNVLGYVRRAIFLSLKETLNNIVKHSKATEVSIIIVYENQNLNISIKDNGVGLDEEENRLYGNEGNGLNNLRKGISKLNGNVEIQKDNGTIVIFFIPI
jgi:signal transduction histidine kinase/tetratricopeptide (TPR) repeat protein